MPKIEINKVNVVTVLKTVSDSLNGNFRSGNGEAIMTIDNEYGVGSVMAFDFSGNISCLVYNIEFKNQVEYFIEEKEERHLYFIHVLQGYFAYKLEAEAHFHKLGEHENIIVEIDPEQRTQVRIPKDISLKYLVINVDNSSIDVNFDNPTADLSEALQTVFSTEKNKGHYRYHGKYSLPVMSAMKELYKLNEISPAAKIIKEGIVRKILGYQLLEYEQNLKTPWRNLLSKTEFDNFQKIISYIESNLSQKHSVGNLAEIGNSSEKKIQQIFKRLYNKTAIEFVNELRMEKSRELLLGSNLNITEIAFSLGFSNTSYFTTLFKRKYKYSPKAYQKKFKQE
ncbi:helix-turn-helix domain-containing protein [Costertonia aggregata]|uniref:Helix-turn-helix transcriptional regulator n=1 Tax=Costertonia aggregata TaxID=343403 RepID=A0A7H9ASY8_9FLAO|nr:AraC family transcriptional regulator [Costertonia aggregata]QLG46546.1 helix-turn-helix transcriptional regulator [Costertonia aggregata]